MSNFDFGTSFLFHFTLKSGGNKLKLFPISDALMKNEWGGKSSKIHVAANLRKKKNRIWTSELLSYIRSLKNSVAPELHPLILGFQVS